MIKSCPTKEERMRPLQEWLDANRAQLLWSTDVENVGSIAAFGVNGHVFLVQTFEARKGDYTGCNVYMPDENIEWAETLAKLSAACGVS